MGGDQYVEAGAVEERHRADVEAHKAASRLFVLLQQLAENVSVGEIPLADGADQGVAPVLAHRGQGCVRGRTRVTCGVDTWQHVELPSPPGRRMWLLSSLCRLALRPDVVVGPAGPDVLPGCASDDPLNQLYTMDRQVCLWVGSNRDDDCQQHRGDAAPISARGD